MVLPEGTRLSFRNPHFGNRQAERLASRALALILQSTNCTSAPLAGKDWPIGLKIDGFGHMKTQTHSHEKTGTHKRTHTHSSHVEVV